MARRRRATLLADLPKGGMVYGSKHLLTLTQRRDDFIYSAFARSGYVTHRRSGLFREASRTRLDAAVRAMFRVATDDASIKALKGSCLVDGLLLFTESLKPQIPWAASWSHKTFLVFFVELVEARQRHKAAPKYPFKSEAAPAVDAFLRKAGCLWDDAMLSYHCLEATEGLDDEATGQGATKPEKKTEAEDAAEEGGPADVGDPMEIDGKPVITCVLRFR
ncbi:hypothetical protein F4780DRAFT_776830 [Xylariomycetidae sp. FL0641]|nr:hypothetical protein F4780DRAFT_776830 [Xylariomycetidae sp. FL0641]